ncbi:MAG: hypothetical protein J0H68_07815 [Sphingobacteriia bacterium]|nr:hypothetical protein [Sphingobacteriia bacterium]
MQGKENLRLKLDSKQDTLKKELVIVDFDEILTLDTLEATSNEYRKFLLAKSTNPTAQRRASIIGRNNGEVNKKVITSGPESAKKIITISNEMLKNIVITIDNLAYGLYRQKTDANLNDLATEVIKYYRNDPTLEMVKKELIETFPKMLRNFSELLQFRLAEDYEIAFISEKIDSNQLNKFKQSLEKYLGPTKEKVHFLNRDSIPKSFLGKYSNVYCVKLNNHHSLGNLLMINKQEGQEIYYVSIDPKAENNLSLYLQVNSKITNIKNKILEEKSSKLSKINKQNFIVQFDTLFNLSTNKIYEPFTEFCKNTLKEIIEKDDSIIFDLKKIDEAAHRKIMLTVSKRCKENESIDYADVPKIAAKEMKLYLIDHNIGQELVLILPEAFRDAKYEINKFEYKTEQDLENKFFEILANSITTRLMRIKDIMDNWQKFDLVQKLNAEKLKELYYKGLKQGIIKINVANSDSLDEPKKKITLFTDNLNQIILANKEGHKVYFVTKLLPFELNYILQELQKDFFVINKEGNEPTVAGIKIYSSFTKKIKFVNMIRVVVKENDLEKCFFVNAVDKFDIQVTYNKKMSGTANGNITLTTYFSKDDPVINEIEWIVGSIENVVLNYFNPPLSPRSPMASPKSHRVNTEQSKKPTNNNAVGSPPKSK